MLEKYREYLIKKEVILYAMHKEKICTNIISIHMVIEVWLTLDRIEVIIEGLLDHWMCLLEDLFRFQKYKLEYLANQLLLLSFYIINFVL